MNSRNKGKILLSTATAAATFALGTVILMTPAAAPEQDTITKSGATHPAAAISAMAFASASDQPAAARQSVQATTPSSSPPAGGTPVFALEVEAVGKVSLSADRATRGTSMARVTRDGDLYPQGRNLPPAEKVSAFLERHGAVFGIDDAANQLRVIGMKDDQYGNSRVTYQQMHGDVPVFGGVMHGHVSEDNRLMAVNGKFIPDVDLPQTPVIGRAAASRTATSVVSSQLPSRLKNADLTVASTGLYVYREFLTRGTPGANHLAYEIQVTHGNEIREFVYVDAINGKLVDQISGIQSSHGTLKHRTVFQSEYNPDAPQATMVWDEANGDLVHDAAYSTRPAPVDQFQSVEDEVAGAGYSYNLFLNLSRGVNPATGKLNDHYAWRSWDGNNAEMLTVNTDPTIVCPNANWNGTSTNYCIGTTADDVVAHEWGHAYTQETSGLIYAWQSGALNESYSDIWGETVDLLNSREGINGPLNAAQGNDGPRSQDESVCSDFNSETNPGDDPSYRWLMGEDAVAFGPLPPAGDNAIRDMWNPRCVSGEVGVFVTDPGHVKSDNYHCSESDGGGVHTNSAINNRAYALLVDGNTLELQDDGTPFANPVTVNGIGLTKAAHIFWRANSQYNTPATSFAENADALEMACADLVGINLTKLVTSLETETPGEDITRAEDANNDRVDPPMELSGEIITAADCGEVANAIAAVEMREDVTKQCGFKPMLSQAQAPMCGSAAVKPNYSETFASGFFSRGWSTDGTSVNPATKTTDNWVESMLLPNNPDGSMRAGEAAFQENGRYGNCADQDESGNQWLESPPITLDAGSSQFLMFEHYFHSEISYDGGNVMISLDNGASWDVIPASAFVHNPYNGRLESAISDAPNTGPKAGQEAWHGSNQGESGGDWGQSQIDLRAIAGVGPGSTIRLRWDFGQDGCNGSDEGWYIDQVEVFSCGADSPTEQCNVYPATGFLPVVGSPIVSLAGSITTAEVSGEDDAISDVNIINLTGSHTYMGDLTFELESPAGTTITLFDGASCAEQQGIDVNFDDQADTVIGCFDWTSGGTFKPFDALAAFNGEDANGDWTLDVFDAFPLDEGQIDSWAVELCSPIDEGENVPPVAVNDDEETSNNEALTIYVLDNDYDPDETDLNGEPGVQLKVIAVTQPTNGDAVITDSGTTVTYISDGTYVGIDNFLYTIEDEGGATDTASVTVTVTEGDPDGEGGDEAKGSGKMNALTLGDDDEPEIDFHFDPKRKSEAEIKGHLHLKDKEADVKIHMKDITSLGQVVGSCGGINNASGNYVVEFRGTGKFEQGETKVENAEFRACAVDNDELDKKGKKTEKSKDGESMDRFHLECISGCSYNTGSRVDTDDILDKGNIRIELVDDGMGEGESAAPSGSGSESSASSESSSDGSASTVFLEPALLSEGAIGAVELFQVNVYDSDFQPVIGRTVTLNRTGADGSQQTLNAITGPTGTALFNVVISATESDFSASVDGVSSNGVNIRSLLQ